MKKRNPSTPLDWANRDVFHSGGTFDPNKIDAMFPAMPEAFDERVRATLANLPERAERVEGTAKKPRRAFRLAATVGIAATLCVGMTAVAANVKNWFPTLMQTNTLDKLVTIPEPTVVSNDAYELALEALVYDEAAGTILVSVRLTNKKQDGVLPFVPSRVLTEYQKKDMAWTQLAECYGCRDGELSLNVFYNEKDVCFGKFYLNETDSTDNVYYLEGAFVLDEQYTPGTPFRLEAEPLVMGADGVTDVDATESTNLTLPLPIATAEPIACVQSADGAIVLSEIGLHIVNDPTKDAIYNPADTLDTCLVDALDTIELQWKDGKSWMILDEKANVDCTLYTLGSSTLSNEYDTATYVLARAVDCSQVQAIVLNGKTFPLS